MEQGNVHRAQPTACYLHPLHLIHHLYAQDRVAKGALRMGVRGLDRWLHKRSKAVGIEYAAIHMSLQSALTSICQKASDSALSPTPAALDDTTSVVADSTVDPPFSVANDIPPVGQYHYSNFHVSSHRQHTDYHVVYSVAIFDAKNFFFPLFLQKARQIYSRHASSRLLRKHSSHKDDASAAKAVHAAFHQELHVLVQSLSTQLRGSARVIFVWDRPGARTRAKASEYTKRATYRAQRQHLFRQAQQVGDEYARSLPGCGKAHRHQRNVRRRRFPNDIKEALWRMKRCAPDMVAFPYPTSPNDPALLCELPISLHDDDLTPVSDGIPLSVPNLHTHVMAIDEADNCIARIARAYSPQRTVVVVSQDTDFLVREPIKTIPWTVSRRGGKGEPCWQVTDRSKLPQIAPAIFSQHHKAQIAALICGQVYTGSGISGVSWSMMDTWAPHFGDNISTTVDKLRAQSSTLQAGRRLVKSPDFEALATEGLRVWTSCYHLPPLHPDTDSQLLPHSGLAAPPGDGGEPAVWSHSGLTFPFPVLEGQSPHQRIPTTAPKLSRKEEIKRSRQVFRFSHVDADLLPDSWDPNTPEEVRKPEDSTKDNKPDDPFAAPDEGRAKKRRRTSGRTSTRASTSTGQEEHADEAPPESGSDEPVSSLVANLVHALGELEEAAAMPDGEEPEAAHPAGGTHDRASSTAAGLPTYQRLHGRGKEDESILALSMSTCG